MTAPATKPARETASRPAPVMPAACQTGGCGGGPTPRKPPPPRSCPVRVNGVEIPEAAIAREMQHHPASDAQAAWTEAARALAVRELLLQQARRLAIDAETETDETGRAESMEDALIRELLEREIEPQLPSETECRRYYEAQRERFCTPALFEVSHILIEADGDDAAAWARAETQARSIAFAVGNDPQAFAEAARTLSACPSARQDGSLGQVRRGDLVAPIQAAVETLAVGTATREPVRSRFGWHVIRLQRRIEGRTLPFDVVSAKIAEMLGARAWSLAAMRYVAVLAADAAIEGVVIEAGAA